MSITIEDTLGVLNAGVFMKQVDAVAKQIALAVLQHGEKGRKGKLKLELTMTQLNADTGMLNVEHKWAFEYPTMRGDKTENSKSTTPMCVSPDGELTLYPLEQTDMFQLTLNPSTINQGAVNPSASIPRVR